MTYLDRVEILSCFQCKKLLTPPQSYRKNKFCGVACMGLSLRIPGKEARDKAACLRWRLENKEHLARSHKQMTDSRKKLVYDFLGNKCVQCGFSDERALQIDHVIGFGLRDKKNNPRCLNYRYYYKVVYESILKKENKYQLLCANCNWIKRYENKENGWDYKRGRNPSNTVARIAD